MANGNSNLGNGGSNSTVNINSGVNYVNPNAGTLGNDPSIGYALDAGLAGLGLLGVYRAEKKAKQKLAWEHKMNQERLKINEDMTRNSWILQGANLDNQADDIRNNLATVQMKNNMAVANQRNQSAMANLQKRKALQGQLFGKDDLSTSDIMKSQGASASMDSAQKLADTNSNVSDRIAQTSNDLAKVNAKNKIETSKLQFQESKKGAEQQFKINRAQNEANYAGAKYDLALDANSAKRQAEMKTAMNVAKLLVLA